MNELKSMWKKILVTLRAAFSVLFRVILTPLLFVIGVFALFSISPIYDFDEPKPFCGPSVFNPYSELNDSLGWKRANFHTHTKVKGLFNECDFWPDTILSKYRKFGYDIVTFSNHNKITTHPSSPELQVNVYEHGYNLFKYHKLVFGSERVCLYDNFLPFLASQRQFQMDILNRKADFVQLNHPSRTNFTSERIMSSLSGYQIVELDSGRTTEQEYWDCALSAGHYSFALANDDLHHPDIPGCFAVRANFLNCPSGRYGDIRGTLLSGAYYCMRVPDYGNGDWTVKKAGNAVLPYISGIGLNQEKDSTFTAFITLDRPASLIKVYGQNHEILDRAENVAEFSYGLKPNDSYARFQAYFDDGAIIYTNAFARFDPSVSDRPSSNDGHSINIILTILFNLLVLSLSFVSFRLMARIWKRKITA